jgi:cyclophilin family peptidyl-prolyl cis-trans isomerase
VAAARRPGDANSGGTQFFIVLREQPSLKGQYTIFGEVSSGIEIADQISTVPSDGDKARERVEMQISVRDAPAPSTSAAP